MGGCRCSFRNCENSTNANPGMHFFHFPVRDVERCEKWASYANNMSFLQLPLSKLRNKVICEVHFRDHCFMNYKKERLIRTAIPTIMPLLTGEIIDFEVNESTRTIYDAKGLPSTPSNKVLLLNDKLKMQFESSNKDYFQFEEVNLKEQIANSFANEMDDEICEEEHLDPEVTYPADSVKSSTEITKPESKTCAVILNNQTDGDAGESQGSMKRRASSGKNIILNQVINKKRRKSSSTQNEKVLSKFQSRSDADESEVVIGNTDQVIIHLDASETDLGNLKDDFTEVYFESSENDINSRQRQKSQTQQVSINDERPQIGEQFDMEHVERITEMFSENGRKIIDDHSALLENHTEKLFEIHQNIKSDIDHVSQQISNIKNVTVELTGKLSKLEEFPNKLTDITEYLSTLPDTLSTIHSSMASSSGLAFGSPKRVYIDKSTTASKVQLFNGIKKYLNPSMIALLRMEMFGGPERVYRPDEKNFSLELYKLNGAYDYMRDEWRFRLPPKKDIEQWIKEREELGLEVDWDEC